MKQEEENSVINGTDQLPLLAKDSSNTDDADMRLSTSISFFIFGLLVTLSFTVILSAAQDILAGTSIPTSIVLIANRGPSSLTSFVAPFFMKRIPYSVRYGFVFASTVAGYLVTALSHKVGWRLAGVALASLGNGVASISCIALASHFHVKALSFYSSGTGFGFFSAPLYYTAVTTWVCISPENAIIIFTPVALLYLTSHYTVNNNMKSHTSEEENKLLEKDQGNTRNQDPKYLTISQKLSVLFSMLFRCFLPVFFGFLSQYMLLQAVITTISYQSAPFPPRDHYQYYIFIYMVGEFLGRCHRAILRFINPALLYKETSLKLWMVSLTQVAHVVFFGLESWFRFLPGVYLALFFTFNAGLAVGILFNNMLEYLSVALTGKEREFLLGYISFPMFCGSFVAALVGISVENFLKSHCESSIVDVSYCLTRISTFASYNSTCGV